MSPHEDTWKATIQAVNNGVRKSVNTRIVAHADVPQPDPSVRLAPREKEPLPPWVAKVADGWHALSLGNWRMVIFAVRTAGRVAAFVPAETPKLGFAVSKAIRIDTMLGPLEDVLPAMCWNDAIRVFSLEVDCKEKGDILWVWPVRATPVLARGSGRAAADGEGDAEADGRSSGSDSSDWQKLSDLSSSDKEHFELCSSDDSDSEGEAAAADQDASDSEDRDPRAPAHTHTAWQNDYFVLTDNRNYGDVRMRVIDRWTGPAHLGRSFRSKTLVPGHVGDDRHEPDQVFLVLRAWMLYRWQGNGRRFLELPVRMRAWQRELDALRADIGKRGGAGALRPLTLLKIREWAPEAVP